jgi:hypothetical protein
MLPTELNIRELGRCCLSRWMLFQKRTVRTKFDIYVFAPIIVWIQVISLKLNLFSPWYSWKNAEVTKTTLTHSLTHSDWLVGSVVPIFSLFCGVICVLFVFVSCLLCFLCFLHTFSFLLHLFAYLYWLWLRYSSPLTRKEIISWLGLHINQGYFIALQIIKDYSISS